MVGKVQAGRSVLQHPWPWIYPSGTRQSKLAVMATGEKFSPIQGCRVTGIYSTEYSVHIRMKGDRWVVRAMHSTHISL